MNEQDLIQTWKSLSYKTHVVLEQKELISDLEIDIRKIERTVTRRDLREISFAYILMLFFAVTAYFVPSITSKVGAAIVSLACLYIAQRLRRNPKQVAASFADSLLTYLQKTRAYLIAQKSLLESVFWWYILPPFIGVLVLVVGLETSLMVNLVYICFLVIINGVIYALNRYAAKQTFLPKIETLDSMIADITEKENY